MPLGSGVLTESSAKHYRWGTHRLVDPTITVARLQASAARLGITRVARVTGLDFVGIPVVMVVRPASRNLSVMQGKGLTDEAALASGLAEALESFCSERIGGPVLMASAQAAHRDPSFVIHELMVRHRPPPEAMIPWTECHDMFGGRTRCLASELVFADFSSPPPAGQGFFVVTTNGLAAGNSREEALLHALCEVIERDAVALWMTANRQGRATPPLDIRSLKGPGCHHLLALLEDTALFFQIWDITSDIGVPCFMCAIDDQHNVEEFSVGRIAGAGCHPNADVALCRAISEAAQARLTIIVGARDDIELDLYRTMNCNGLLARIFSVPAKRQTAKFEDRSMSGNTIGEDLRAVLNRLDACGIGTVVYSELPCPVEHMSCVRVLAPQLESVSEKSWYRPGQRARALSVALQ
ncbi:MAG: YcaO-like family protein [Rhodospirillales bacterium]|nr:YcaO-like family protein [Rhodospirillales bacterium]